MRIVTDIYQYHTNSRSAIAIGKFDGVHLGHRKLLREILDRRQAPDSADRGLGDASVSGRDGIMNSTPASDGRDCRRPCTRACVVTFDPLPEVYFGTADGGTLSTREEKRRLFDRIGIDTLIELQFNHKTASMEPEGFVRDILCGRLNACAVVAGPDLSFGDRGRGDFALLKEMAGECCYDAVEIEKAVHNGRAISSTMIRSLVRAGKMEEVTACLGEPYRILGTVIHGNAVGRSLGIPTVNQIPETDKLLPPRGVYYSLVELDGRTYPAMTNIGVKPTVTNSGAMAVETHLYDYTGDLYGRVLSVSLLTYRRPEMRFSGIDELRATMQADLAAGRMYHHIAL